MMILNQVHVNLIYNTNLNLLLCIEIFICRTDLYSATADRWWCHLPNRNVCATQIVPMRIRRSVPLRSYIKGTDRATPCQNIDTTRKAFDCATTLPLTVFIVYNETLQLTFRPLLSKLSNRRQIQVIYLHFEEVSGDVVPCLMARWKPVSRHLLSVIELLFVSLMGEALQGKMSQNSLPSRGGSRT